jgi:hypothetical protein
LFLGAAKPSRLDVWELWGNSGEDRQEAPPLLPGSAHTPQTFLGATLAKPPRIDHTDPRGKQGQAWPTSQVKIAASSMLSRLEVRSVVQSKTIGVVTELTLITPVKPGAAPALRQALAAVGQNVALVRQMETIHFARWVLIDNDTRLLFTSNFDGGWEQYLRDFMRVMPQGLDHIWGACVDYPGCIPYEPFAEWVRKYQIETTLFYAAYPAATVKDVIQALDWKGKVDQFEEALAQPPASSVGQ